MSDNNIVPFRARRRPTRDDFLNLLPGQISVLEDLIAETRRTVEEKAEETCRRRSAIDRLLRELKASEEVPGATASWLRIVAAQFDKEARS